MQDTSQEMPNVENFKNLLKPYLIRWGIVYALLLTFIISIIVCISMPKWGLSQSLISWLFDMGAIFDGKNIHYGVIIIGAIAIGIIPIVVNGAGVFAFGVNVAGVFAFGVNAVGVVAIGTNAIGIIAIGVNAFGIIAIGVVSFGIVAIGRSAFGRYALSYSQTHKTKAKYLLAPHRQDPNAIDFFTRWFPKLTPTDTNPPV